MRIWKTYRSEIGFTVLSLLIGGLGGLLTKLGMPAYELLAKPWFTPPAWLFPVVWTILFILMGIGMGRVWRLANPHPTQCLRLYFLQLAMNLLWTFWFFTLQQFGLSFLWLLGLWAAVLFMTLCFRRTDPTAALLQLPYLLWLVLAAALNYSICMLNP